MSFRDPSAKSVREMAVAAEVFLVRAFKTLVYGGKTHRARMNVIGKIPEKMLFCRFHKIQGSTPSAEEELTVEDTTKSDSVAHFRLSNVKRQTLGDVFERRATPSIFGKGLIKQSEQRMGLARSTAFQLCFSPGMERG